MEKGSSSAEDAPGICFGIEKLFESSDTTSQIDKAEKKDEVKQEDDLACTNNKVDKAEKKDEVKQEDDLACTNNKVQIDSLNASGSQGVVIGDTIDQKKVRRICKMKGGDSTKDENKLFLSTSGKVTLNPKMLLDDSTPISEEIKYDVSADGKVTLNKKWLMEDF